MKAALDDHGARPGRKRPVVGTGDGLELVKIDQILSALIPIGRQQLERYQVAGGCHRHAQFPRNCQYFGGLGDLWFNAAGREQKVDNDTAGHARAKARGREPTESLLLHNDLDDVPASE